MTRSAHPFAACTVLALLALAGCNREPPTVVVTPTVTTPGPPGPAGSAGETGATGKAADNTTVIVVTPPASAPSN